MEAVRVGVGKREGGGVVEGERRIVFLLILYIGNKASLAIRHEIYWSLEMLYCGVPLYLKKIWSVG